MTKVYCDSCGKWLTVWYEVDIGLNAERPDINVASMCVDTGRKHLCQNCMGFIKTAIDEKRGYVGEKGE